MYVSGGEGKLIQLITRILKLPKADIFILDEPLNHLSFENSRKFNDVMIEEIRKKKKALTCNHYGIALLCN